MNTNDNFDSTAPLPNSQYGDFETFVRHTLTLILTRLTQVETTVAQTNVTVAQLSATVAQLSATVAQLSTNLAQLTRDQHDRYVDLRMRLTTVDEKLDAHLREVVILKRDLRKLQDKVDPTYSA